MKKQIFLVLFVSLISGSAICQQKAGKVLDSILCDSDKTNAYCLFLPSEYVPGNRIPVVFIHDPAARANLAVHVFKNAAERYQYILACSYATQNGTDLNSLLSASRIMQEDVMKKYSVDTNRIYLCGFSGGSRLSTAIALHQGNIAGVISVGAGLPGPFQADAFNKNIIYAVVTGTYDMNYIEQLNLRTTLELNGISARFFEFDGGHEWCDSTTTLNIFEWIEYRAMLDGLIVRDTSYCNDFMRSGLLETQEFIRKADPLRAQVAGTDLLEDGADSLQYYLDELTSLSDYLSLDETEKKLTQIRKILSEEETEKENYITFIQMRLPGAIVYDSTKLKKDPWWKQTSAKLKKQKNSASPYEAESAARLFDFLYRNTWELGDIYYAAAQYSSAKEMYYLLTLLEEESIFAFYKLAKAEAALGNSNAAIHALQSSVNNGFTNTDLLQREEAFVSLRAHKKFIKLLDEITAETKTP
ncbi:MAG: TPR end-of-group domain-containing protein [Chitinophagales bacterium]